MAEHLDSITIRPIFGTRCELTVGEPDGSVSSIEGAAADMEHLAQELAVRDRIGIRYLNERGQTIGRWWPDEEVGYVARDDVVVILTDPYGTKTPSFDRRWLLRMLGRDRMQARWDGASREELGRFTLTEAFVGEVGVPDEIRLRGRAAVLQHLTWPRPEEGWY